MTTPTPDTKVQSESLKCWLADPVKVLRLLNNVIAAGCLLVGFLLTEIAGLAFAFIGTVTIIELRKFRK